MIWFARWKTNSAQKQILFFKSYFSPRRTCFFFILSQTYHTKHIFFLLLKIRLVEMLANSLFSASVSPDTGIVTPQSVTNMTSHMSDTEVSHSFAARRCPRAKAILQYRDRTVQRLTSNVKRVMKSEIRTILSNVKIVYEKLKGKMRVRVLSSLFLLCRWKCDRKDVLIAGAPKLH